MSTPIESKSANPPFDKGVLKAFQPDHQLPTHSWNVFHLCFSPTQNLLAVGARDKEGVTLVDTNTWTIIRHLPDFTAPPSYLEFSPDGRTLVATEGSFHAAFCWNMPDGAVKWSLPKKTYEACFSPDGSTLVVGKSKSVLLLDPATGTTRQQLNGHDVSVRGVLFSPDGRRVLSAGKGQAWLWDPKTAQPVRLLQQKLGQILDAAFSSTGLIALATQKGGVVRFYDALSGEPHGDEITAHESGTFDLDFTADGKFLVTSGMDPVVRVWDVATRSLVRTLEFSKRLDCPYFKLSPDGNMIVVSLQFPVHAAHLYDLNTGSLLAVLAVEGFIDPKALLKVKTSPQEAAFSPRADWLAIACDDGNTRIWSMKRVLE